MYLAAIGLVTLAVATLPVLASVEGGMTRGGLLALGLLGLVPASDIAVALTHRMVTKVFGPQSMPRLALTDGIPASLRTFVVMPTLLGSAGEIAEHIERLETHYLSNRDSEVYFALLTDWRDADAETSATDGEFLAAATAGIEALNARHRSTDLMGGDQTGTARFFLLHRARRWNPSEHKWMGWERKRGKLHEFNRLLRGTPDTSFIPVDGQVPNVPSRVRYVVTVDADTKLPFAADKATGWNGGAHAESATLGRRCAPRAARLRCAAAPRHADISDACGGDGLPARVLRTGWAGPLRLRRIRRLPGFA